MEVPDAADRRFFENRRHVAYHWRRTHSVGIVLRHLALLAAGLSVVFAQAVFRSGPPVTAVIALVAASPRARRA
jgi:hypothetical protein